MNELKIYNSNENMHHILQSSQLIFHLNLKSSRVGGSLMPSFPTPILFLKFAPPPFLIAGVLKCFFFCMIGRARTPRWLLPALNFRLLAK